MKYCTRSRSDDYEEYFLCTFNLKGNSSIFFSKICQTDSRGNNNFNVDYTFNNLFNDFEILLTIYILKVPKQNFARRCLEKIFRLFIAKRFPVNDIVSRDSLFNSWREVTVKIGDINETKEVVLGVYKSTFCNLTVDVSAEVDLSNFCQKGWLDFSHNGLFWQQKWCVLRGTQIVCYDSPNDTVPKARVDLNMCTSIRVIARSHASRDQVIKLEVQSGSSRRWCFFMCAKSSGEFYKWKVLQNLVPMLKCWREAGCLVFK
ncbi:hypothetical protein Zmor_002284 [Zophobas morio]|uniref:PH domain-containing protein n=1 Tax=Zophobas morio TaxID=2755281 RepID=A0AA38J0M3_9CUCU|nr:hypothetical protein Zmor_002284 [Zophobas morio]